MSTCQIGELIWAVIELIPIGPWHIRNRRVTQSLLCSNGLILGAYRRAIWRYSSPRQHRNIMMPATDYLITIRLTVGAGYCHDKHIRTTWDDVIDFAMPFDIYRLASREAFSAFIKTTHYRFAWANNWSRYYLKFLFKNKWKLSKPTINRKRAYQ